jgi:hypothetical protein
MRTYIHTYRYTDRQTDRQTGKPIDRHMEILRKEIVTDRQCERVMRKTDRHSEKYADIQREKDGILPPTL